MHLQVDTLLKVTQNVTQYSLHHVTYLGAKFEVATSNGLRGEKLFFSFFL